MRVSDVLFSRGLGGFFFDDQSAIRESPPKDGFLYRGNPKTAGYSRIREPSESVSVMLILEDGQVAIGDCCAVQYSGVGGREPFFRGGALVSWANRNARSRLVGLECSSFRESSNFVRSASSSIRGDVPKAFLYGITQALLDAAARSTGLTMAEVIAQEYSLPLIPGPIRLYAQSGDDWETNVDKMILKRVDVLPHGLVNDPKRKIGTQGEILRSLVASVRKRVLQLRGDSSYQPELHFDVYGGLSCVFRNDLESIADYLGTLEDAASPFVLRIEAPIDAGSLETQLEGMATLRRLMRRKGLSTEIVVDEWCNSLGEIKMFCDAEAADMVQVKMPDLGEIDHIISALLYCREKGVKALQGGSCTETDISARVSVHIALACRPYQLLAKPGMGVDEGVMIVRNEMERALALLGRGAGG
jgi:methylaspartate ammonia-lyase